MKRKKGLLHHLDKWKTSCRKEEFTTVHDPNLETPGWGTWSTGPDGGSGSGISRSVPFSPVVHSDVSRLSLLSKTHARSFPAPRVVRDSPIVLIRPSPPEPSPEKISGVGGVLYCLPPRGPQGKPLQFHSFDEAYVERLRVGDFRTQEHFVGYFSQLIQMKLRSRLRSPEAAEDVRQETFARVLTTLRDRKIASPERLGAFVFSTCNNVLLEHYRSAGRATSLEGEEKDFPAKGIDLLSALTNKEIEEKVREILEDLSERDRRLLREIFFEERDKDEICRDFGVDREYLRVLLHRAKQAFKSLYLKSETVRPRGIAAAKL